MNDDRSVEMFTSTRERWWRPSKASSKDRESNGGVCGEMMISDGCTNHGIALWEWKMIGRTMYGQEIGMLVICKQGLKKSPTGKVNSGYHYHSGDFDRGSVGDVHSLPRYTATRLAAVFWSEVWKQGLRVTISWVGERETYDLVCWLGHSTETIRSSNSHEIVAVRSKRHSRCLCVCVWESHIPEISNMTIGIVFLSISTCRRIQVQYLDSFRTKGHGRSCWTQGLPQRRLFLCDDHKELRIDGRSRFLGASWRGRPCKLL